ncbi:hypothetical protein QFC21_003746 [Naganishia friedmannii]|uniref:Uncharacterized protein n=1 Tax=Naganishia friedmannii TaxID=89922 RepID=A0ACC2VKR8_9TREE|nr:hypothetical protein QFC21_003746 [Naganishia friedmannii]
MRGPTRQRLKALILRPGASGYKDAINRQSDRRCDIQCATIYMQMAEHNITGEDNLDQEKPQMMHIEHQITEFQGGQKIGRRLTDDSLHHDHPINLPRWRKTVILITLAWSGFLANSSASAHLAAFPQMAKTFGLSAPFSTTQCPERSVVGRTYLLGSTLFIPCVVWMAMSNTYSVFCVGRFFAGFFSAVSQTVPPASIADIYPSNVRGDKMAIFGEAVIIAPAISPVIGGLVIEYQNAQWRIIHRIVLGFAILQLFLFTFFVPETLWVEDNGQASPGIMHVEEGEGTLSGEPVKTGKRGASWLLWHRPTEFGALAWSPIAMVGADAEAKKGKGTYLTRCSIVTLHRDNSAFLLLRMHLRSVRWPHCRHFPSPEASPYKFGSLIVGVTYLAFGIGSVLGK